MQSELAFLLEGVTMTGDIHNDVAALLTYYGREVTLEHSGRVAREAKRLATLWGANPEDAEVAGWLHDISAVIPNVQRIPLSERLGLEILPEERLFPMIIHQKLSVVMARDLFGIRNEAILRRDRMSYDSQSKGVPSGQNRIRRRQNPVGSIRRSAISTGAADSR